MKIILKIQNRRVNISNPFTVSMKIRFSSVVLCSVTIRQQDNNNRPTDFRCRYKFDNRQQITPPSSIIPGTPPSISFAPAENNCLQIIIQNLRKEHFINDKTSTSPSDKLASEFGLILLSEKGATLHCESFIIN